MNPNKQKNARLDEHARHSSPRKISAALIAALATIVVAIAVFLLWPRQPENSNLAAANNATSSGGSTGSAQPKFQVLKGQWLRPDGGYIIDIATVEADGKMQAGYYNPNPIRVSQAEAAQQGASTTVFIELNDIGYPGSTYRLTYDPANDQLQGVYYQAAIQQSFDVVFVRMK